MKLRARKVVHELEESEKLLELINKKLYDYTIKKEDFEFK